MSKNSLVASKALTNQWTLRVVHALRRGPLRFNQLDRVVCSPNPPALSARLKAMQRDGLISRHVLELGPPARVEYVLTALGLEMANAASELVTWVEPRMPQVEIARDRYAAKADEADENATA